MRDTSRTGRTNREQAWTDTEFGGGGAWHMREMVGDRVTVKTKAKIGSS
jgi:hypothetical protein